MGTLFLVLTIAVVVGILLAVLGGLVEMTPIGHHVEQFRDKSGRRIGSSPRLD